MTRQQILITAIYAKNTINYKINQNTMIYTQMTSIKWQN